MCKVSDGDIWAALYEIVDVLDKRHGTGEHGNTARAVTGEEFVTICGISVRAEGEHIESNRSPVLAVASFYHGVMDYIEKNGPGKIYWRVMPELNYDPDDSKYWVRARLLISDKKPLGGGDGS